MKIYFYLLFLLFTGCMSSRTDYSDIMHKIMYEYVQEVCRDGSFVANVSGGGMMGDIQRVALGFEAVQNVDVMQARNLLVQKEEQFLALVNSNREVRPFLHTFPFVAKDFRLSFSFIKPDGSRVDPPNIAFVFVQEGEITYCVDNRKKTGLDDVHTESYAVAYKIVYGDMNSSEHR